MKYNAVDVMGIIKFHQGHKSRSLEMLKLSNDREKLKRVMQQLEMLKTLERDMRKLKVYP